MNSPFLTQFRYVLKLKRPYSLLRILTSLDERPVAVKKGFENKETYLNYIATRFVDEKKKKKERKVTLSDETILFREHFAISYQLMLLTKCA